MDLIDHVTSADLLDKPIHGTMYVPALGYNVSYTHTLRQQMRVTLECRGWTSTDAAEYMAKHFPQPEPIPA